MRPRISHGIVAAALALTLRSAAVAATLVVAPDGDDGNPGTPDAPLRSIARAVAVAEPGDTICIRGGDYAGGIVLAKSGTPDAPIRVRADGRVRILGRVAPVQGFRPVPDAEAVFAVSDPGPVHGVAIDLETTPLVIDGLAAVKSVEETADRNYRYYYDAQAHLLYVRYARRDPPTQHTVYVLRDGVGMSVNGSHITVDGLDSVGFAQHGIAVGAGKHVAIRNCRTSLCGVGWGSGICVAGAESAAIVNCILFRVGNGILLSHATKTEIAHNTLYRTRAHGILINGGRDNRIRNNILFAGGRSGSAVYVDKTGAKGLHLDFNCYLDYACTFLIGWMPNNAHYPTFWDCRAAVPDQDRHSICDAPRFVSAEPGREDFALRPHSPRLGKANDATDIGAVQTRR